MPAIIDWVKANGFYLSKPKRKTHDRGEEILTGEIIIDLLARLIRSGNRFWRTVG
jgi:hypothetical protein